MATEFILIPKHKYEQLQKDASTTVKDLLITEPSTDNNNSPSATTTTTSNVKQLPHGEPAKPFHHPDHAKLDEASVSDTNSDNGDDDYDTTDVLESFNSSKVKCMHPILSLMEQNADILKKTGEIVFHNKNIIGSNIIELLKDMFIANLHPVGKLEFYRGLDLLKVKLTCVKHPKNKALLTIMKGEKKIVNKKNNGGGRKMKHVKKNKNWYRGCRVILYRCMCVCVCI